MAKYEVVKPWGHQVSKGDIIDTDSLHPSLKPHVREVAEKVFEVQTPKRKPKKKAE